MDNTLLDLQNSSYPTQPHSIIAKYWWRNRGFTFSPEVKVGLLIDSPMTLTTFAGLLAGVKNRLLSISYEVKKYIFERNGRSNPEVVGSIPTEVKRFFLYLVWFPDSLY